MTFTRKNHGDNHSYYLDGVKIPGVTSIIGVLDKPALVQWAATSVATHAVDNWDRLAGMPLVKRYEELKMSHRSKNREAIIRGKRIHALAERIIRGEEVDPKDASLVAAAQAYADLLDAWELEPVLLEASCVNRGYMYAGTLDGVMRSPKLGTIIVDVKTGKKAYSEVALQLAAYRNADVYLEEQERTGPRGGKLSSDWIERAMPEVYGAAVIHIERETDESPAAAHLQPVKAGPDIFEQFLFLCEIHAGWVERTGYDHRKSENYNPPVGAPLYPEQPAHEIREAIQS